MCASGSSHAILHMAAFKGFFSRETNLICSGSVHCAASAIGSGKKEDSGMGGSLSTAIKK